MARVKICGSCGKQNAPNRPFCGPDGCGFALGDAEIVDAAAEPAPAPAAREEREAPASDYGGRRTAPGATWRGDGPGLSAVLTFPWGDVEVGEALFVGRDAEFSALSARLEGVYGWVSAKHAELYVEDGKLHVRDMGSTNGTYVNGKRIDNHPVALSDGDRVSFSRRLVTTVRIVSR